MAKKLLILGMARSGKDTFAELICKHKPSFSFESSSLFVCEKAVFPTLSGKYGYKTIEECYEDRDGYRPEWFELISAYNSPKYRLAEELLSKHDIYVGLRNNEEYQACLERDLFDLIFWVDGTKRTGKVENRESFNIDYDPGIMFWIDNNRSLKHLEQTAAKFAKLL